MFVPYLQYEVYLSGKMDFVGFLGKYAASVYEQDQFGVWDKMEESFIQDAAPPA